MKILFFSDNFPPERNAAATRVYERAIYWVRWGHEVTVITCVPNFPEGKIYPGYKNKWYQVEMLSGIRVIRVKTFMAANSGFFLRILDFLSYMFMAIIAGFFQERPDIIVSTSPQFFAAVGAWFLSEVRRIPYIFELGDLWPASIKAVGAVKSNRLLDLIEKLELFLYRRSKRVICLTASFKEDLIYRGIPGEKIDVVINGVELSTYHPQEKDKNLLNQYHLENKFVVSYIGTHGMAHAIDNIVETAHYLKENQRIHFLLVGTGAAKEKAVQLAERYGLSNITFVPPQDKSIIARYWSLSDVALIHLKKDSLFAGVIPSKIFEAMGMGIPLLIASPKGEGSQIIEQTGSGVRVPAEDPKALAEAVLRLQNDLKLLKKLSTASFNSAQKFSREKQAKDFIEILERVLT